MLSADLQHIEETVAQIQQALKKLDTSPASRSVAVDDLSEEVQQKLHCVQSHLVEVKNLSDLEEPLYIVSGMCIFLIVVYDTKLYYRSSLFSIH